MVTTFTSGIPSGPTWISTYRGGRLFGDLDPSGRLTADQVAHVFPDYRSAYVGRFEDGRMVAARPAAVVGHRCGANGILLPRFSEADPADPAVGFTPPNNHSFGGGPQVRDPYEESTVRLGAYCVG